MKKLCILTIILLMLSGISASAQDYLVKYSDGTAPPENSGAVLLNESLNLYAVSSQAEAIALSADENVEYVEEDVTISLIEDYLPISLMSIPTDELYGDQWQIQMVKAQAAWDMETYGNEIRVAVIDSGCADTSELTPNIVAGHNYITGTDDYSDAHGHGTNVSGIIAARHNGEGFAGIAPKAKLVQLKCFHTGQALSSHIAQAIVDAVDIYDCKVINLSLGFDGFSQSIEIALRYAVSKGAIPVAAAGNNHTSSLSYPASSDYTIGVGSVDINKNHSEFSQYNSSVFVVAPGERVLGLGPDGKTYYVFSGTSQSTPQVAAAAAIALSAYGKINFSQFKTLLASSCDDLGDKGYDYYYGNGLLNIEKMMDNIMKIMPFYISPVYETNGKKSVLIKNNTDTAYNVYGIWVSYDEDGTLIDKKITVPTIAGSAKIPISFSLSEGTTAKFLLWSNIGNLSPIYYPRTDLIYE